eukprot:scaffold38719_cov176-Amphora_coffeaeformis.AAC.4
MTYKSSLGPWERLYRPTKAKAEFWATIMTNKSSLNEALFAAPAAATLLGLVGTDGEGCSPLSIK